ncbi:hypothetical protein GCM10010441_08090 [Kitasatospora paracochleata]
MTLGLAATLPLAAAEAAVDEGEEEDEPLQPPTRSPATATATTGPGRSLGPVGRGPAGSGRVGTFFGRT